MSEKDYYPAVVSVHFSEPWMDRPFRIELTSQINTRQSSTQTIYLDRDEAAQMIRVLTNALAADPTPLNTSKGPDHD